MKSTIKSKWLTWACVGMAFAALWPVSCAQGKLGDRLFGRTEETSTNGEEEVDSGEAAVPAESKQVDIKVGGLDRYYILHLPAKFDKSKPTALVLNLHGGGGNPAQQERDTEMDKVADKNGFIVVYPGGTGKFKTRFLSWNIGMSDTYATINNVDDIGFIKAVIDEVSKNYNVDKKRIYSTGFSQGAIFSYKLACEMSDTIAAIAPVSGVMQVSSSDCHPTRPVSIIHFHGLQDPNVAYNGGIGPKAHDKVPRPSVMDSINFWLKEDGLNPKNPSEKKIGEAEEKDYGKGKQGAEIILWTLDDGGHAWPGGQKMLPEWKVGKVNMDINASQLIWEFFDKHPMP